MNRCLIFLLLVIAWNVPDANAQGLERLNPFRKSEPNNQTTIRLSTSETKSILNDIIQLGIPNMRGRVLGTTGELVAISYLSKRFRDLGLVEIDKNYQRKYTYFTGESLSEESFIRLNNETIRMPQEGFPLSFSDTQLIETYIVGDNNEPHSVWVVPAYRSADEAKKSFAEREKLIHQRILNARERGAIGVVIYNNFGSDFIFQFRHQTTLSNVGIPVFEIARMTYEEKFSKLKSLSSLSLHAKVSRNLKQGVNLYGIINNGAEKTVIISANYDGYVPPGVDLKNLPHLPGANTNASGVAAVLNLVEKLSAVRTNYNYLVILYSGTYQNLEGSTKMFEDKNFFKEKVAFAIHLDQIGRMNPLTKNIFVSGVGTFAGWRSYFNAASTAGYDYVLEPKGQDMSDFQTYYKYKIPYLRFTTGANEDAGTPYDNHAKINMEGVGEIVHRVYTILLHMSTNPNTIQFIAATDQQEHSTAQTPIKSAPSVSLGVVPDLQYTDGGLRIHRVNKGQDGANAGIMEGDIIIQIRNFPIQNYDDYLNALAKFKKGEKTYFRLKRKGSVVQKVVTFS